MRHYYCSPRSLFSFITRFFVNCKDFCLYGFNTVPARFEPSPIFNKYDNSYITPTCIVFCNKHPPHLSRFFHPSFRLRVPTIESFYTLIHLKSDLYLSCSSASLSQELFLKLFVRYIDFRFK